MLCSRVSAPEGDPVSHFLRQVWRVRWMVALVGVVVALRSFGVLYPTWPGTVVANKPVGACLGGIIGLIYVQQAFPYEDHATMLHDAMDRTHGPLRTVHARALQELARARTRPQRSALEDGSPTLNRVDDTPLQLHAFVGRVARPRVLRARGDRGRALGIDEHDIGIGAHLPRPLPRVEPEDLRRTLGEQVYKTGDRNTAFVHTEVVHDRQQRFRPWHAERRGDRRLARWRRGRRSRGRTSAHPRRGNARWSRQATTRAGHPTQ